MSEFVTQEVLEQTCREWQDRLRLRDWDVIARWQDWISMSVLGRSGEVSWNLQQKSANIHVLPPHHRCDGNEEMTAGDWEQTLVHELLHLHFAPFDDTGGPHETAQEQALNAIAAALVSGVREARAAHDDAMVCSLRCEEWQVRAEEVDERASGRERRHEKEIESLREAFERVLAERDTLTAAMAEASDQIARGDALYRQTARERDEVTEAERSICAEARLCVDLVEILSQHCGERGDNEGAVATLQRILRERDELARRSPQEEADACPDCNSSATTCWDCKDEDVASIIRARDEANRALEMERAAHRVTADRLNRLADEVRERFPWPHYVPLDTMMECGDYGVCHCAECQRFVYAKLCDKPTSKSPR